MDWKLELVSIPVTDVDRANDFYADKVGFHADHDHRVHDALRFVQLTPPGSACSIVLGDGHRRGRAGVGEGAADRDRRRRGGPGRARSRGVEASEVDEQPWGRFVYFSDPDGNHWALQQMVKQG